MWLISGWFLAYAVSILGLVFGIQRLRESRTVKKCVSIDQITVVVPFRNEANNLKAFLECIHRQKYQPVQWIFVNDHSTDDYKPAFAGMELFPIRVLHLPIEQQGKKAAIRFGMDHATTDYCLTMDADVIFGSDYMKQLLTVPAADLVVLPVLMTAKKWWHAFFTLEYFFTVLMNRGISGWWRPVNASGANLLFRIDAFEETDDLELHEHIASGDDMYTLRAFREHKKIIEVIENEALTVYTATPSTIGQTMDQRVRWLSKTGNVGDHLNSFLGIWAVALHVGYFLLLILTFFAPALWLTLLVIVLKTVLDAILLQTGNKQWNLERVGGLVLFELFYPVYLFALLGSSLFAQPEWKGR